MAKQDWHLDKKITIAMIIAVGGAFISGIMCYANIANDVSNTKTEIARIQEILNNRAQFGLSQTGRVDKLETRMDYTEQALKDAVAAMNKGLDSIVSKIDEIYEVKRR